MQNTDLNSIYKWGRVVLVCLSVFLIVMSINFLRKVGDSSPVYNSISVTGEGEALAIPDVASFSFTVSANDKSVASAQEAVTTKVDAILSALKTFGVEERDLKTTDYSVYPKYVYTQTSCTISYCEPGKQVQDGYTASHSVTVKVRATDKAGEALALAGDNGATNLSGLSFVIDNPDAVTAEARAKAIADAKEKAKVLSKQLGVRLVRVIGFYDNNGYGGPVATYRGEGVALDTAMVKAPTLPTGESKTTISVNVIYEIK